MNDSKTSLTITSVISDFKEITKMRLSISVVFSSLAGYLLGVDVVDFKTLILLALGGYFMVGASNAYNQIIEKDLDALMKRTKNRPIPSGRMSVNTAFIIATVFTLLGIIILYTINRQTAMFGAISIFLYKLFKTNDYKALNYFLILLTWKHLRRYLQFSLALLCFLYF